ncbi:MAG: hypothetical protein EB060_11475, partial [Proteobacteria bacterium]|nr:hypothetical protein [Pseudomonadota bacterium]
GRSRDEARSFIRDWKAQYDIKNREKNSQYHKEKAKVTGFRDRVNERERKRRSTNISHRIGVSFRSRVSSVLKQRQIDKTGATMALIGCSLEQFRMWLEINFEPGMSWDNYGHGMDKWNIDHWHPCAAFDLTDHEQLATCFHWSNQFPCWQRDNIRKSSRVIGPLSDERVRKIEAFKRELLSAA